MANEFDIEVNLNLYIKLLVDYLVKNGNKQLADLIKFSSIKIETDISYDNWNNGQYGHGLILEVSPEKYLECVDKKNKIEKNIAEILSKIYPHKDEWIDNVTIVPVKNNYQLLDIFEGNADNISNVTKDDEERIWGNLAKLKFFLSHRDTHKIMAMNIKNKLIYYNISTFVAHIDIEPSEEWIQEIKIALAIMDVFIAYLTDDFYHSLWTNQEIGIALALGVPIIFLKNGSTPQGLTLLQAMSFRENTIDQDILRLLLKKKKTTKEIKSKIIDAIIFALNNADSWDSVDKISQLFEPIDSITVEQENEFIAVFNSNKSFNTCISQSRYDINGNKRGKSQFTDYMKKWTKYDFEIVKKRSDVILQRKKTSE
jgi:hypothetical protein